MANNILFKRLRQRWLITKARKYQASVATSKLSLHGLRWREGEYILTYSLLCCFFLFRYFGRARDLPGVRELFEQEGKNESKMWRAGLTWLPSFWTCGSIKDRDLQEHRCRLLWIPWWRGWSVARKWRTTRSPFEREVVKATPCRFCWCRRGWTRGTLSYQRTCFTKRHTFI